MRLLVLSALLVVLGGGCTHGFETERAHLPTSSDALGYAIFDAQDRLMERTVFRLEVDETRPERIDPMYGTPVYSRYILAVRALSDGSERTQTSRDCPAVQQAVDEANAIRPVQFAFVGGEDAPARRPPSTGGLRVDVWGGGVEGSGEVARLSVSTRRGGLVDWAVRSRDAMDACLTR